MAMDSAFRPASVRPPFLTGTRALIGPALGAAAAGAAAAAFAALIAAQRFFVPANDRPSRRSTHLPFHTVFGGFESDSTDGGTARRSGPGVFCVVP